MFLFMRMQMALALGCAERDLPWLRDRLRAAYGTLLDPVRLTPLHQLVKSFISSRTLDEVSQQAYHRLITRYQDWPALIEADWREIRTTIATVTHVDPKAQRIGPALAMIGAASPGFCLDFLGGWPVEQALAWLERLPGVGRKIAASTLNFSSLRRPAFVVDMHVLRVMRRFGLVAPHAPIAKAYAAAMEATEGWSDRDLLELHVLMKKLGQATCRPMPQCGACPLLARCGRVGVSSLRKSPDRASEPQ